MIAELSFYFCSWPNKVLQKPKNQVQNRNKISQLLFIDATVDVASPHRDELAPDPGQREWELNFLVVNWQLNRWPCQWVSQTFISSKDNERHWKTMKDIERQWKTINDSEMQWKTLNGNERQRQRHRYTAIYWQIEKLESWHWGLVIDCQRVTWTAFAILAVFLIFSLFSGEAERWQARRTLPRVQRQD